MQIMGAVLEQIGRNRPYVRSAPLSISELELGPPGAGQVLVRIEAAGVCHSDLSVVDGSRVRPVPMLLGHEAAGIVEALGATVDDLRIGDRVVLTFLPRCGQCEGCASNGRRPCVRGTHANNNGTLLDGSRRLHRRGQVVSHHLGVSAFATHAVVDAHSVVRVDLDIPAEIAALLGCAVLTGGGAVINDGQPKQGDTVIVVGLGGVGMAALITAVAQVGVSAVGVDSVADKRDQARALGASHALDPSEALARGIQAPIVIEAAGNVAALETAIELTAPGGRTITVGLPRPDARATISPLKLVAEGRSIIGSYLGSAIPSRDIPLFGQLWRDGRLPVGDLISAHISLEDINHAMDQLADGVAVRQIINFC